MLKSNAKRNMVRGELLGDFLKIEYSTSIESKKDHSQKISRVVFYISWFFYTYNSVCLRSFCRIPFIKESAKRRTIHKRFCEFRDIFNDLIRSPFVTVNDTNHNSAAFLPSHLPSEKLIKGFDIVYECGLDYEGEIELLFVNSVFGESFLSAGI